MTKIIIVVSPSFDRRGKRRQGKFDARLQESDEVFLQQSRQPLLDASRLLVARGYDPSTPIAMVHSYAPTAVTLRARSIGEAAKLDVMGDRFVPRKATARPMRRTENENFPAVDPKEPCNTEAVVGAPHTAKSQPLPKLEQSLPISKGN